MGFHSRLVRFTLLLLLLSLLACGRLSAQIYADVSVSEDGQSLGTFRIELHHETVPRIVANFVGLASGQRAWVSPVNGAVQVGVPYYDGLTFHRLDHDFIIQAGDPLGTGSGGPGYVFQDQFDPSLRHNGSYVVSMANSGVNSNGSQFFITLTATSFLDDLHSVFGTVINDASFPGSRALIDSFKSSANFPTDGNERPLTPLTIDSVTLSGPDLASFDVEDPSLGLPSVEGLPLELLYDSTSSRFDARWSRQGKWDYPLYYSDDLGIWTRATNVLSMNAELDSEIEVSGLFQGDRGFITMAAIDYTHTPDLPVDIFDSGDSLVMEVDGGTLTLLFDGVSSGSWSFEDTNQVITNGAISSYGRPQGSVLFGIPSTGRFTSPSSYTYARSLAARDLIVFFDGPVGPNQITAIQPELSFHTGTSGWYNGPVNSNLGLPGPFRGTFTWVPAGP